MKCRAARLRLLPLALLAGLALGGVACDSGQAHNARLMKQWTAKMKETADLLASVKDVPSAQAAKPRLAALLKEFARIEEQLDASYDSEDVAAADAPTMTRHAAEGIGEMQRAMAETLRISKEKEWVAALGETWKELPATAILDANGMPSSP